MVYVEVMYRFNEQVDFKIFSKLIQALKGFINCWGYKDFPCSAFHFVVSPFLCHFKFLNHPLTAQPMYQLTILSHYLGYPLS